MNTPAKELEVIAKTIQDHTEKTKSLVTANHAAARDLLLSMISNTSEPKVERVKNVFLSF